MTETQDSASAAAEGPDAMFRRAHAARTEGRIDVAVELLRAILAHAPSHPNSLKLLSLIYRDAGQFEDAGELLTRLVAIESDVESNFRLYGEVLIKCGRERDALRALKIAFRLDQSRLGILLNIGLLEAGLEQHIQAIQTFNSLERRFVQSGRSDADREITRRAMKARQKCLQKLKERFETESKAAPLSAASYCQYAQNLGRIGLFADAVTVLERARNRFPFADRVPCDLLRYKLLCCNWTDCERAVDEARTAVDIEILEGKRPALDTLIALTMPIPASEQLAIGRAHAAAATEQAHTLPALPPVAPRMAAAPITLGYLSGRFLNDATAHLMLGLFRRHDRKRFRVFTYSFGGNDGSGYRRRIVTDSDRFIDLRGVSDADAAAAMRQDGVDILVDVDGFNPDARPVIAAQRPAPVQLRYLDYPASSGAGFFDYFVTDRFATPPGSEADWSERLIRLPYCYQVNDRDQTIEPAEGGRGAHRLAASAFVLASFCSMRKIEPAVFGAWMEILKRVPDAVLWLLPFTSDAARNLHAAAQRHGIAPERIIFAPFLPRAEHLSRMALADLSLDTLHWGGHTTTSESLWAGVPVITTPGATFASRVAGSLLTAIGLPELIAPTLADYVELAVTLAGDRARLAALRRRLADNRLTAPLFDTDRYVRDLERAYLHVWARHEKGLPPESFALDPAPQPAPPQPAPPQPALDADADRG